MSHFSVVLFTLCLFVSMRVLAVSVLIRQQFQMRVVIQNCSFSVTTHFLSCVTSRFKWRVGGKPFVVASQFSFPPCKPGVSPNPDWDSLTLPSNVTGTRSSIPQWKSESCFWHVLGCCFSVWFIFRTLRWFLWRVEIFGVTPATYPNLVYFCLWPCVSHACVF